MYSTAEELGLSSPRKPRESKSEAKIEHNGNIIVLPDGVNIGDYGTYKDFVKGYNIFDKCQGTQDTQDTRVQGGTNVREKFEPANTIRYTNTADPKVWGPHYWFSLHNSSMFYPDSPSIIVQESMKGRIMAIPFEIPCASCRHHAVDFIQGHVLDNVVSSRENLIKFYVDFHNQVNRRYGKPVWSYDQVKKMYGFKP